MTRVCALAVAAVCLRIGVAASAQDLSRYRGYALEASLAQVLAATGSRADEAKTVQERPARIQELQVHARYQHGEGGVAADPMRVIDFSFVDDRLYQLVVNYDASRTEGLTDADVIESLGGAYGVPVLVSATSRIAVPPGLFPDTVALARWEDPVSSLVLVRARYSREFQLVMTSKALGLRARTSIAEARRLDALEAPRREIEQRKKDVEDAAAARDKTRTANKGAFRP
jgi:hypothetical protein